MAEETKVLDVSAESSTAKTGAESAAATGAGEAKETKSLEDVIRDTFKASSSGDKAKSGSGVQELNKTQNEEGKESEGTKVESTQSQEGDGKTKEGEQGEKQGEEGKKEGEEGKNPVPYERFEEVNTKKEELEQRFEQLKPLLEAQQSVINHCVENNISEQQFYYWMDIAGLANSNPIQALEKLQPILEQLQGLSGDSLPKDLQEMVDNNEIPLALAKRLAKAEAMTKFGEGRSKVIEQKSKEQLMQEKQKQFFTELTNSMEQWKQRKATSDPDFMPKQGKEAPDGKFEFFLDKFELEVSRSKPKSAQELVALADKVYASLGTAFEKLFPKKAATRHVHSNRSTTTGNGAPKSLDDAISQAAAKHGIAFSAPSRK